MRTHDENTRRNPGRTSRASAPRPSVARAWEGGRDAHAGAVSWMWIVLPLIVAAVLFVWMARR
jgi:hypothetical protein